MKKTLIFGHTTANSEVEDKAAWHRRHRAVERVRLQASGEDYQARSDRANSNSATFAKDRMHYWGAGIDTAHMRK